MTSGQHGKAIDDLVSAVENLNHGATGGAAILALSPGAGRKLNAAEPGAALRTNHVASTLGLKYGQYPG